MNKGTSRREEEHSCTHSAEKNISTKDNKYQIIEHVDDISFRELFLLNLIAIKLMFIYLT
jgi:hypothetical protein